MTKNITKLYDYIQTNDKNPNQFGSLDTFSKALQNPNSAEKLRVYLNNEQFGDSTTFYNKVNEGLIQQGSNSPINQQTVYEDEGLQATKEQLTSNIENQKKELEQSQPQVPKPTVKPKNRSFISKLGESYKRTEESSKLDQLTFLAATNYPGAPSIEEVDNLYQEYIERAQQDPIKAENFLGNMLIGTAGLLGSFGVAAKEGGIQGAAAGMTGAALAGNLSPLAVLPEELATIPAAGALGFKTGSSIFFAQQGAGSVIRNLRSRGVDSDTATYLGAVAGVPYALLEQLQFTKLIPKSLQKEANDVVTKTLAKQLSNLSAKYGKDLVTNVAQEDLQLVTTTIAEELGVLFDNKVNDGEIEQTTRKRFFKELGETTLQTGMSLIPLSGANMAFDFATTQNVVSGLVDSQQEIENQSIDEKIEEDTKKQPKTEVSPKTEAVKPPKVDETKVEPDQESTETEVEPPVIDAFRNALIFDEGVLGVEGNVYKSSNGQVKVLKETPKSISVEVVDGKNKGVKATILKRLIGAKGDNPMVILKKGKEIKEMFEIDMSKSFEKASNLLSRDQSLIKKLDESQNSLDSSIKKYGFGGLSKKDQNPNVVNARENNQKIQNEVYETLFPDRPIGTEVLYKGSKATLTKGTFDMMRSADVKKGGQPSGRTYSPNVNIRTKDGDLSLSVNEFNKLQISETSKTETEVEPIDFSKQIEKKYNVTLDLLGKLEKNDISLSKIVVPEGKRGEGVGTKVIADIIEYADRNNKRIVLTPTKEFGATSVKRLKDLYKKFGFVENKGKNKDFTTKELMYRVPKNIKTEVEATETQAIQEVVGFFEQTDPDIDYQVNLDETRTIFDAVDDPKSPETLGTALEAVNNAGKELEGVPISEIELTGENFRESRDEGLVDVIKINKGADIGTVVEERSETWYSNQEDTIENFDDKIGALRDDYYEKTGEVRDENQSNKEFFSNRVKDYVFSKKTRKNLPTGLIKILDKFKKYANVLAEKAKKFGKYVKENKVSPELQDMLQRSVTEGIQVQPTKQKAPGYQMRKSNETARERARLDEQTQKRTLKENYEDLKNGNTLLYDDKVAEQISKEKRTGVKSPIYAGNINLDKLDIDNTMKSFKIALSKLQPTKKVSWDETGKLRGLILDDYNKLIRTIKNIKKRGNIGTAVEIDALRQVNVNGIYKLKEMATLSNDKAAIRAVENYYNDIFTLLSDVASETGRALNIFKRDISPRRLSKAIAELEKGMTDVQLEQFKDLNMENPLEVERFIKRLKDPTLMDYVYEFWYNSILSGIPTHLVNIASNTLWMSYQVPQRLLSGSVDAMITQFKPGRERSRYVNEIIPMMAGMKEGFLKGAKRAKTVIKTGETPIELDTKWDLEMGGSVGAFERSPNQFVRKLAPYVSIVGRGLRAMDVWANSIAFDAEINAQAKRITNQEKLKGDVAKKRELELRREPSKDMVNEAKSFAKYTTFMDNPGKIAQTLAQLRNYVPGGRFVVPFVNTLANITKRGYEFVPGIGLVKAPSLQGKGQYQDSTSDVIAKQVIGTIISATLLSKYEDDEFTGAVPKSKTEREAFYRQGKQPWSIKIGDTYYSYRRIEPFNTVLASATIAAETIKSFKENEIDKADEAFFKFANNLVTNFINSSMLKGVNDLFDENKRPSYIDRFAGTFIPYSSFWRSINRSLEVVKEGDANVRDVKSIADGFTQNLPFGTLKLKPKMNVWGEEIVLEGGVLRQWLPFKYRTKNPDKLEIELERIGLYPSIPEKKYNHYDMKTGKTTILDIPDKIYEEGRLSFGKHLKESLTNQVDKVKNKNPEFSSNILNKFYRIEQRKYRLKLKSEMLKYIKENPKIIK